MVKIIKLIRIILEIILIMSLYYVIGTFAPVIYKVSFLVWIAVIIFILLYNYDFITLFFTSNSKSDKNDRDLFNIYYINYPKVFELCMLINNKREKQEEISIKNEKNEKKAISFSGTVRKQSSTITPTLGSESSFSKTIEYRELQEIKETNSTYLSEIIDECESANFNNLVNGSLIKLDNVKLKIINKDEIAQINSMLSGIFRGNKITTDSDGQTFNIDINALNNILLKDYKYILKGSSKNIQNFYIGIPIKAEKEFENDYSIYDLEIGNVTIIGIYRTDKYVQDDTSTFSYLLKKGNQENSNNITSDELFLSDTKKSNTKTDDKLQKPEYPYIDLVAIIQDLKIKGVDADE